MHPNIRNFKRRNPELVRGLDPNSFEDTIQFQEQFRVGTIRDVIFDKSKQVWKAIVQREAAFMDKELPPFCSVAIYMDDLSEPDDSITKWRITLLAGLTQRPAYGNQAIHEGTCNDTLDSCKVNFSNSKDVLNTELILAKERFSALLSTDNPAVNVVPVFGKKRKKKIT